MSHLGGAIWGFGILPHLELFLYDFLKLELIL